MRRMAAWTHHIKMYSPRLMFWIAVTDKVVSLIYMFWLSQVESLEFILKIQLSTRRQAPSWLDHDAQIFLRNMDSSCYPIAALLHQFTLFRYSMRINHPWRQLS